MCLIIYKPAGKDIPEEHLRNGWDRNSDGAGLMFPTGRRVGIHKELVSFDAFLEKYRRVVKWTKNGIVVVHFRYSTSGLKDLSNCHPFRLKNHNGMAVCHNGVISIECADKTKSDTVTFCEEVLDKLPVGFLSNKGMAWMLAQCIGFSKLVFMEKDGTVALVNQHKGDWEDGCWYSSGGYKTYKAVESWEVDWQCWNRQYGFEEEKPKRGRRKRHEEIGVGSNQRAGDEAGGV